jgi:hypothetical protein
MNAFRESTDETVFTNAQAARLYVAQLQLSLLSGM